MYNSIYVFLNLRTQKHTQKSKHKKVSERVCIQLLYSLLMGRNGFDVGNIHSLIFF